MQSSRAVECRELSFDLSAYSGPCAPCCSPLIPELRSRVRTSPPQVAGRSGPACARTSQDARDATAVLQLQHTQRQTTTVLRLQRLRRQGRALARQLPNECAPCCRTDSSALATTCTAMTSCTAFCLHTGSPIRGPAAPPRRTAGQEVWPRRAKARASRRRAARPAERRAE